jgi:hypothetical protein
LLEKFGKNMTESYNNIINGIQSLIISLRNEEKERLPRIANSLNDLIYYFNVTFIKKKLNF